MGTKPAKAAHRPSWPTKAAKPGLSPVTEDLLQKGLRSAGGLKLLKWGLPGRGVKSAKVRPTPYGYASTCYYPRVGRSHAHADRRGETTDIPDSSVQCSRGSSGQCTHACIQHLYSSQNCSSVYVSTPNL